MTKRPTLSKTLKAARKKAALESLRRSIHAFRRTMNRAVAAGITSRQAFKLMLDVVELDKKTAKK